MRPSRAVSYAVVVLGVNDNARTNRLVVWSVVGPRRFSIGQYGRNGILIIRELGECRKFERPERVVDFVAKRRLTG